MSDLIVSARALSFPWGATDPFLFCAYHKDGYPAGNDEMGPATSLAGRQIGQDFAGRDGWNMYHGETVPGFPRHPHRGFETVTIMRSGFTDHSDSLGAAARFGPGDVQWITAGKGIVHAEMFPLLDRAQPNPLELFQIWLNLPARNKFADPFFSMLWSEQVPRLAFEDGDGRRTEVMLVAGRMGDTTPPAPPPHSWAADAANEVMILTARLAPGARWTLPKASPGLNRTLYFFNGESLAIDGRTVPAGTAVVLRSDLDAPLQNGAAEGELLLLQGRPIGEPVAQYGPFVMNSRQQLEEAFHDYQRTQFGGWPFDSDAPVHPREQGRFARRPDGSVERPTG